MAGSNYLGGSTTSNYKPKPKPKDPPKPKRDPTAEAWAEKFGWKPEYSMGGEPWPSMQHSNSKFPANRDKTAEELAAQQGWRPEYSLSGEPWPNMGGSMDKRPASERAPSTSQSSGGSGSSGGGSGGGGPHYDIDLSGLAQAIKANPAALMGLKLGDMYDLTYDSDKILGIFNDASKKKFESLREDYSATENQYLKNLLANQDLAQQTLRANNSKAIATGASEGMLAANQLSAVLGMQQQGADGALELSNERNKLVNKEAAEIAENSSKALETSNAVKKMIADLDLTKYGYDTQNYIGQLDYNAAVNDALAAIISAQIQANRY